jgi:hypothetical protein
MTGKSAMEVIMSENGGNFYKKIDVLYVKSQFFPS